MKKPIKTGIFAAGQSALARLYICISRRALKKDAFCEAFLGETSANTPGNVFDKWFTIKKVHCAHFVSFDTVINDYTERLRTTIRSDYVVRFTDINAS